MIGKLGEQYTGALRRAYASRVPGSADFVCFWFERAREQVASGNTLRAGLVATQSIREGASRTACRIVQNKRLCFQEPVKVGPFDVDGAIARKWLSEPLNANGLSNAKVLYPLVNASDPVRRPTDTWIVDFGRMDEASASYFLAHLAMWCGK